MYTRRSFINKLNSKATIIKYGILSSVIETVRVGMGVTKYSYALLKVMGSDLAEVVDQPYSKFCYLDHKAYSMFSVSLPFWTDGLEAYSLNFFLFYWADEESYIHSLSVTLIYFKCCFIFYFLIFISTSKNFPIIVYHTYKCIFFFSLQLPKLILELRLLLNNHVCILLILG